MQNGRPQVNSQHWTEPRPEPTQSPPIWGWELWEMSRAWGPAATHYRLVFFKSQPAVVKAEPLGSPRPCFTLINDPSAGSPTETLLRLLLPLNDQV